MADPFPRYDVLGKHDSPSWNPPTRAVVDARLDRREDGRALSRDQLATLRRLVSRVAPQPECRAPANTVAILLEKITADAGDGFRPAALPRLRECWRRGLDALRAEAESRHGHAFADLEDDQADSLLRALASGETLAAQWDDLPAREFWQRRVLPDVVSAHWAHPSLWSAMGFGGPAGPRGYVRLDANRRDGWEAKEQPGG